jgi:hypothetical protein
MTIVPDLSRVPHAVEWSILRSADLQATRRRLQRTLGRWGVDEWRHHSATALERKAFADRTWAWRAAARGRMLRPAAVRRAVLVAHGAAAPAAVVRRPAR